MNTDFPSSKESFVLQFQTITCVPYFQTSCPFLKWEKKPYRKGYTIPVYSTTLNLKQILGTVLHSAGLGNKKLPTPSMLNITVYGPLSQYSLLWMLFLHLDCGPTKCLAMFHLQTYLGKQSTASFKYFARCFSQTFLAAFPCADRIDTLFYSPYLTQKFTFLEAVFLHLIIFIILKLIISILLSCHTKSF